MKISNVSITVSDSIGAVSGEWTEPDDARIALVLAHGAGASMEHPFMTGLSQALASIRIATLRYNFPYMERGSRRPDVPAVAGQTVVRAVETGLELAGDMTLLAGGKSFGGRMTSLAMSKSVMAGVKGLVFAGFPLHPAGKPAIDRAGHLAAVNVPMLFLQGTRDALADRHLIAQVCGDFPQATLRFFEGADHAFKAGKINLLPVLAATIEEWALHLSNR